MNDPLDVQPDNAINYFIVTKETQKCSRGHHLYSPNNGLISTGREIFKEQCCKLPEKKLITKT